MAKNPTIERIQTLISQSDTLTFDQAQELQGLLDELHANLDQFSEQQQQQAAELIQAVQQKIETHQNLPAAVAQMQESDFQALLGEYEATHPQTIATLRTFIQTFLNMGV